MPSKAGLKRTIKLRQPNAAGNEFIRVSPKNKTDWASCNLSFEKPIGSGAWNPSGSHGNVFTLTNFETNLLFGLPSAAALFITSSAVSVPVGTVYALSQFQLASSATIAQAAISANPILANIAGLLGGSTLASIFVSPDIKIPEFANFNKPCDSVGQGKF